MRATVAETEVPTDKLETIRADALGEHQLTVIN
jgi:hypothetical protein